MVAPSLKYTSFLSLSIPKDVKETIDPVSKECADLLQARLRPGCEVKAARGDHFQIRLGTFYSRDADHAREISDGIRRAIKNIPPFTVSPSKDGIKVFETHHPLPHDAGQMLKFQTFVGSPWESEGLKGLQAKIKTAVEKARGKMGREEFAPYTNLATVTSSDPQSVKSQIDPHQLPHISTINTFESFPRRDLTITDSRELPPLPSKRTLSNREGSGESPAKRPRVGVLGQKQEQAPSQQIQPSIAPQPAVHVTADEGELIDRYLARILDGEQDESKLVLLRQELAPEGKLNSIGETLRALNRDVFNILFPQSLELQQFENDTDTRFTFPEEFISNAKQAWETLKHDPLFGLNREEIEPVVSKIWTLGHYSSMDEALQTLHIAFTTLRGILGDKAKDNDLFKLIGDEEIRLTE